MDRPIIPDDERLRAAFDRNRLLATFDEDLRQAICPSVELVDLAAGQVVLTAGQHVERTLFPLSPLMISLIVDMSGGRSVEVASIGREGAVGGIVSCGHAPAYARAEVQIAGSALSISLDALEQAKQGSRFLQDLFCRYSDYLLSQVMQSVACNAFHSIEARAARWLLTAQDRVGSDQLPLTQETLAGLLGVQRTTVNAVARLFQARGLIAYRRGTIHVRDRAGLERQACECYLVVEGHFCSVIGDSGHGHKPEE